MHRRLLVVLLATVLAVLAPTALASAETRTFYDLYGDSGASLDIQRTRVSFGSEVVVTTKFNQIRRNSLGSLVLWLDTPARGVPNLLFSTGTGTDTDWEIWRTRGWRAPSPPLLCSTGVRRNLAADTMTVRISRACLGRGYHRVRVSAMATECTELPCTHFDRAPAWHRFYPWVHQGASVGGCVTLSEYRRVTLGMSRTRVHQLFGATGTLAFGSGGGYTMQYRACEVPHEVFVTYGLGDRVIERPRRL